MELYSSRFQNAVIKALDSPKKVLGTVQMKSASFIERIRCRKDLETVSVNTHNRDQLPDRILTAILNR